MSSTPSLAPPRSITPPLRAAGRAFDQVAARYDEDFTDSLIGRLQRQQVWQQLEGLFPAGGRVLDLGCGTGADAIHLASRGMQVHAVDVSANMIAEAQRKIAAAGLAETITTQIGAMETWDRQSCLSTLCPPSQTSAPSKQDRQDCLSHAFDGALSNFGALNCVADLRPVALALSRLIRPGGHLALCLISSFCLWETVFYSLQGRFAKATRRWSPSGSGTVSSNGSQRFPVYYHTIRDVLKAFEPEFRMVRRRGVGIFVPPTYLETAARSVPRLAAFAHRIDEAIAPWPGARAIADHALLILTRGRKP